MGSITPLVRRGALVEAERLAGLAPGPALGAQARLLTLLGSEEPLPVLLDALARSVETWAPALLCSIQIADPERGVLTFGAAPRLPRSYLDAIGDIPIRDGVGCCGTAAARCETVIVPDVADSPLWVGYAPVALAHGLRACWSVPMLDDYGRSIGTLALYFPEPRSPTTAERELIDFAAALGRMVLLRHQEAQDHRARDLEQAALETAERDRERTANDLHDGVCQQLAGIDYLLTAMIASAPPAQQRDLLEVRTLVEATLRDTSLMAAWLLPLSHHPEGLGAGLAELRRTVVATRTLQFDVDCDAELARELPPATAAALFALVQAASLHALTASTAGQLLIRIERAAHGARACIEVDNTRFTDATADVELRALRYRARRVGARLMFEAVAASHSRCSIGFA